MSEFDQITKLTSPVRKRTKSSQNAMCTQKLHHQTTTSSLVAIAARPEYIHIHTRMYVYVQCGFMEVQLFCFGLRKKKNYSIPKYNSTFFLYVERDMIRVHEIEVNSHNNVDVRVRIFYG